MLHCTEVYMFGQNHRQMKESSNCTILWILHYKSKTNLITKQRIARTCTIWNWKAIQLRRSSQSVPSKYAAFNHMQTFNFKCLVQCICDKTKRWDRMETPLHGNGIFNPYEMWLCVSITCLQIEVFFFLFLSVALRWGWLKMILQTNRCARRWLGLRAYEMGCGGGVDCWHDCCWKWVLYLSHIDFDCQTSLLGGGQIRQEGAACYRWMNPSILN